jgi:hypothetical protein
MKTYITFIKAVSPITGELLLYSGPNVPGISVEDAVRYCELNSLGYCRVGAELIATVETKQGSLEPD